MFADIQVSCAKDSLKITWKINAEFVPNAARHFLGSCRASRFNVLPTGQGELEFSYPFTDCKFRRLVNALYFKLMSSFLSHLSVSVTCLSHLQLKGKFLIYQNDLTYRPQKKSIPPAFKYTIECVYKR